MPVTVPRPAHIYDMTTTVADRRRHQNGKFATEVRPEVTDVPLNGQNPWACLRYIAPDQTGLWSDAGFAPHVADAWAKEHFGVVEAMQWSTFGARPSAARAWVNLGFTPMTAREWLEDFQPAPDPTEGMVRYENNGLYGPIDPRTALHSF